MVSLLIFLVACSNNSYAPSLCNDGVQNGDETGIDCGGSCEPCFECTSIFCTMIAGSTSWGKLSSVRWITADEQWSLELFSNGKFDEIFRVESTKGYWEFDDPSSPSAMLFQVGTDYKRIPERYRYLLITLKADTLMIEELGTTRTYYRDRSHK